jgi:hypothetical protein
MGKMPMPQVLIARLAVPPATCAAAASRRLSATQLYDSQTSKVDVCGSRQQFNQNRALAG